ncbi:MAG: 6-phosphogluconolactonase [Hyphomonas sp.]|nr:6-phosphogluconolactonase [Hyphomonas sp.]
MRAHVVQTSGQADATAARVLEERLQQALRHKDKVSLALSGGRTPPRVLKHLRNSDIDWRRVVITLTDERWVPLAHADSNEGAARSAMAGAPMAAAQFTGLYQEGLPLSEAAGAAEGRLRDSCPLPIDVAFLGMGEDGHIASLFPGRPWTEADRSALVVTDDAPGAHVPHARISLSASALLSARSILMVVAGDAKKALLQKAAQTRDPAALPVALLFGAPPSMHLDLVVEGAIEELGLLQGLGA